MRRLPWFVLLLVLLPTAAWAKEPKCPLSLDSCLVQFGIMHERPWLGIVVEVDSLGHRNIKSVVPDSPAARAGVRPGDVLESVNGVEPPVFFAGRAGWKDGQSMPISVHRGHKDRQLALIAQHIPEDLFARMLGEHMLEGHLAYMDTGETH